MAGEAFRALMVEWFLFLRAAVGYREVTGGCWPFRQVGAASKDLMVVCVPSGKGLEVFKVQMEEWLKFPVAVEGCKVLMGAWLQFVRDTVLFRGQMVGWFLSPQASVPFRIRTDACATSKTT